MISLSENRLRFFLKLSVFTSFLTFLLVNPRNAFPAVFSKAIYFQIIIEFAFVAYLLLFLKTGKKQKLSLIAISLLVFTSISLIAAFLGINFYRSFWGTLGRMDGLFSSLHLLAFFFILIRLFEFESDKQQTLKFVLFLVFLTSLVGLGQRFGLFSYWTDISSRISSSMGNPNFYAAFLSIAVFLILFYLQKNPRKIVAWLLFILSMAMLLLTGTRGAWLGVICGLVVVVVLLVFSLGALRRKQLLLIVLATISLVSLFLILSLKNIIPETAVFSRYQSLFSSVLELDNSRLLAWRAGINAFKDRPLLGYGSESFSYLYAKYYQYDSKISPLVSEKLFFDRPHNKVIELLVSTGIIGLISYLVIFGLSISLLIKRRSFILVGLLVSYFVQNLFSLETLSASILFIFSLALINSETSFTKEVISKQKKILLVGLMIFSLGLVFFNLKLYFSSLESVRGERYFLNEMPDEAETHFKKSFSRKDFFSLEKAYYDLAFLKETKTFRQSKPQSDDAVTRSMLLLMEKLELFTSLGKEVKPVESQILLAETYHDFYRREQDPKYLEKEERALLKALSLNKEIPQIYRLYGRLEIFKGNESKANELFYQGYNLDNNSALLNEWLGASLIEVGYQEKGIGYLRKAMCLGDFYSEEKFSSETVMKIAAIYEKLTDYRELANFYEEVIARHPKTVNLTPQIYASLSVVYAKIGEREKAIKTAEEMFLLFPQLIGQKEEFLKKLNAEKPVIQ